MPQAAHSINVKHTCTLKRDFELVQHYLPDSDTDTFIYVTLCEQINQQIHDNFTVAVLWSLIPASLCVFWQKDQQLNSC